MKKKNIFLLLIGSFIVVSVIFAYFVSKTDMVVVEKTKEREEILYDKAVSKLRKKFEKKDDPYAWQFGIGTVFTESTDNWKSVPKNQHLGNTIDYYGDIFFRQLDDRKDMEKNVCKIFHPQDCYKYFSGFKFKEKKYGLSVRALKYVQSDCSSIKIGFGPFLPRDGIMEYALRPFEVCFMKQSNPYSYDLMSVSDAMNMAKKYYAKELGIFLTYDDFLQFRSDVIGCLYEDDGYYLKDTLVINPWMEPLDPLEKKRKLPESAYAKISSFFYNDYYRVYMEGPVYARVLMITKRGIYFEEYAEKERKNYQNKVNFYYGASCLLIMILGVLLYVFRERSLYEKLLEKCNPKKYMIPYDEGKVKESSQLYEKLLKVDKDNLDELKKISIVAEEKLGVSFVSKKKIKELKALVNPKKFIKKKNLDLVPEVTKIYNKLQAKEITSKQLFEIQKEIQSILEKEESV